MKKNILSGSEWARLKKNSRSSFSSNHYSLMFEFEMKHRTQNLRKYNLPKRTTDYSAADKLDHFEGTDWSSCEVNNELVYFPKAVVENGFRQFGFSTI